MSLHPFSCMIRDEDLNIDLFEFDGEVSVERETLWHSAETYWTVDSVILDGESLWQGSTLSKIIADRVQMAAQEQLDRQSGRLWERVREDAALMAAE